MYVADTGNNRIQKFTPEGQFVFKTLPGQLTSPCDITIDDNDHLYICEGDFPNCRISVWTPKGQFVGTLVNEGHPIRSVYNHGRLYICDSNSTDLFMI